MLNPSGGLRRSGLWLGGKDVEEKRLCTLKLHIQEVCHSGSYSDPDRERPHPEIPAQRLSMSPALHISPGQLLAHSDLILMGHWCRKLEVDVGHKDRDEGSWLRC